MAASRRSSGLMYDCLLFDLDDTLYPLSLGLNSAFCKNIEEFMMKHLHIKASEVHKMNLDLYKEYGTTMAGLKAIGYDFYNDDYLDYVYGRLPYEKLKPDPVLRKLLLSMPLRKIIFTNADFDHALEVVKRLGLKDCFESKICFQMLNETDFLPSDDFNTQINCKPSAKAFKSAIQMAKADPSKTLFFDTDARNIASGKAAGLHTVIVGRSDLVPGADHALNNIHDIKEALPEIWEVTGQNF